ncbi:hypothetical protein GA707_03495 [Nostocoides sp. F2B08]|uniref:hypothetical protein n=1 Tax=Nostocoides sp. F2B08 TaxID=2653936 RepID=UPI0012632571|nr:hypothetical protein [Tetrasphaera sp. F2B08]KAB7746560.1 hypothetical protein GA707_03495 [Tetrasphaera sp. F2B08]
MTSNENRAEANLVLLCIEHSYEVDDRPDRYPADLLRQWKQAQLDEYEQAQSGWPITDTEAGRALEASAQAAEHHHAGAVIGVVRAVERFSLAARQARSGPAASAAAWRAARARARGASIMTDLDGNRVYAEPSRQETNHHMNEIRTALASAVESIRPLANEAKVETAAARASRPAVGPWSDWVIRAVDEVLAASSGWPGPPGFEDDDRLEDALHALAIATDAFAAYWRGGSEVPSPPQLEPKAEPLAAPPDPLQDHRALLERARPWARVDHRPFDPKLRCELAAAAQAAASIPPVPSALAIGLSATAQLAAAVAGNATDEELALLAEEDSQRRPLSTAVHLLTESIRMAERRERGAPQQSADAVLSALWETVDWSDPGVYDEDDANGHSMFWLGSRITSPEDVRGKLASALGQRPDLLLALVAACAPWTELLDSDTWETTGFQRRYGELPPWFPVEAVVAAAATVQTGAQDIPVDDFGETYADDPESLLAQVLWHAQRYNRAE